MRCLWEDVPDSQDHRGWRRVRCTRTGCRQLMGLTPHPHDRIDYPCRGLPLPWELGHWLTIFLGMWGISERGMEWWMSKFGIKAKCGCSRRRQALNTIGSRFNQALAWLTGYNTNKGER
jgi:hypothetical protein